MKENFNRRNFIRMAAIGSAGLTVSGNLNPLFARENHMVGKRVGIIGLDTSHAVAFTKILNAADASPDYLGYKVVAAHPKGSKDIKSVVDRVPGYTTEVQKLGVEIVDSISTLLKKVDVVLLESNDGRVHLEQAIPVLKAGKRMFIDKPIAASFADAKAIFEASKKFNVPVFSSSSLRYLDGISEINNGKIGKVIGAEAYSPSPVESSHPDLFWYGIHGVEILFSLMGTGCKSVSRIYTNDTDIVVGIWDDNRVGTFRGIRKGKSDYGATVFGEKEIMSLGKYKGYNPLLMQIVKFFDTGVVPVRYEETLEICAFIESADASKLKGGESVILRKG
jgi:hypothetical protein